MRIPGSASVGAAPLGGGLHKHHVVIFLLSVLFFVLVLFLILFIILFLVLLVVLLLILLIIILIELLTLSCGPVPGVVSRVRVLLRVGDAPARDP
jgi:hypothetical protein